ncbi:MAG: hypothetical protein ILP19_03240 [Oscillospiraceae bacterium]|nr:hypothetical protein [Oscillospiraceae bacterium]
MSAKLDLTAVAPQLADAVIYMDGSPAYDAFKEEIEAILADLNSSGHLPAQWNLDPADLTEKSEETLKNMQRAYLIWTFHEQQGTPDDENSVASLYKLFYRSHQDILTALNGGERIEAASVSSFIESFKQKIASDSSLYESLKKFFKDYVYGYFFNFLTEQTIMKNYAEMLAYLGVISNIVSTSVSEQQKVLPKMAPLVQNDRFKYIYGFVPMDTMLNIIFNRIYLDPLPAEEQEYIKSDITSYIRSKYRTESEDGVERVADNAAAEFASEYFSYTDTYSMAYDLYSRFYSGTRTFLDCDREDTGDYNAVKITTIIDEKLTQSFEPFYSANRDTAPNISVGGDNNGFRYPIIFKDTDGFCFASVYSPFVYNALEEGIYTESTVPTGTFAFIDEALMSDPIKMESGNTSVSPTIRRDRLAVAEQIKRIDSDKIPKDVKKMLLLEQYLCLASSNMSAEAYAEMLDRDVFGTDLYEEYIRYRMNILAEQALTDRNTKKSLLDSVNSIVL